MEDVVSKKPPFVVVWGTAFLFFFIMTLLVIFWVVKIPEIVTANARLTSLDKPEEVVTQPDGKSIFMEMLVSKSDSDMIKPGQKVLLKFQAYPFEHYGFVIGKIDSVKNTMTDSGYLAKVILPNGLITSYGRRLLYKPGLSAQADIIIAKIPILNTLYNSFTKTSMINKPVDRKNQ